MQRTEEQKTQAKKPYSKPAFRFERVFEASALSCKTMVASGAPLPITARFVGSGRKGPGALGGVISAHLLAEIQ